MNSDHFVAWLHIGDLHASDEDGWESVATLARIVTSIRANVPAGALDFAFLPGDNANHGEREQYERVVAALDGLPMPRYAIPGDHDFEPGSLQVFTDLLEHRPLPASVVVNGRRALFLDIVSPGGGGPDFRLGAAQTDWLRSELAAAKAHGEPRPLVFMHAFPEDLREDAREVGRLFADARVAFVDTGHTHYNEVLNDGAVIYAATRSTGQIEEGPAGFAIAAVDGAAASWRFKALDAPWPWVLITSPADARMTVDGDTSDADDPIELRALVLGPDVAGVSARFDDGLEVPLQRLDGHPARWAARLDRPHAETRRIVVTATAHDGSTATDEIDPVGAASAQPRVDDNHGSHGQSIGAWPGHDLLGTRLGPNAKGKKW
jgi:hypothetical protein